MNTNNPNQDAAKSVIITGASSGIGEATARRLAREGMRVTLAARRRDQLERVAAAIEAEGKPIPPGPATAGQVYVVPTDVRDRAAIHHLVEATLSRWGRIDVLINNAGLGFSQRVVDLDPERLREQVNVNLVGVIECAQAVLPAMMAQQSGHIINVASIAGLIGLPGSSVYSATKYAVNGFSDALYREVRSYGIHVTALCPGFVATNFFNPRSKDLTEQPSRPEHLPGMMQADYVAARIAALIRHPRRRLIIPPGWGILVWIAQTFPWIADAVLGRYR